MWLNENISSRRDAGKEQRDTSHHESSKVALEPRPVPDLSRGAVLVNTDGRKWGYLLGLMMEQVSVGSRDFLTLKKLDD